MEKHGKFSSEEEKKVAHETSWKAAKDQLQGHIEDNIEEGKKAALESSIPTQKLQEKTWDERKEEHQKEVFYKMFEGSQIFREYIIDSRSEGATTKYEWMTGLYDFMVERVRSIADSLPTSDKLIPVNDGGGSLDRSNISRTLRTINSMTEALEIMGQSRNFSRYVDNQNMSTKAIHLEYNPAYGLEYHVVIDAFDEAIHSENAHHEYWGEPDDKEYREVERKKEEATLKRLKGLPDF